MSDNVQRFRFPNDEDDGYFCTGSADVSPTNVSNNSGTLQRFSAHTSNSFSLRPSEAMSDSRKVSHKFTIEPESSSNNSFKINEKPMKFAQVHAPYRKRSKKFYALRDVGRWKPSDDLLLIISVLQVNDLDIVCDAAKFSCKFTLEEVRTRWNALLYDDLVSSTARSAIRKMHPEQQAAVHRRAPFSLAEEDLLCDLRSTVNPTIEDFENLLENFPATFYHARTAKSLQRHWRLLQKYELLCDQRPVVKNYAAGEKPTSFADAEAEINIEFLKDHSSSQGHVDEEIKLMDQQIKRRIRLLEDELGHWMQLLGISSKNMHLTPNFDSKTYAILRGQHLRYFMRTRFISFGRLTLDGEKIDVDLSVEGPTQKLSRFQGGIELRNNGTFATCNFGKRPFFVDGKPVFPEKMIIIRNNSIFEICGITFIFLINKELVEELGFSESDAD